MRGQTTLDFAIGVSIFLAVVLFTFGFVPSVLDPFDVVAEENPTLADRTADKLVHSQLGSAGEPHILDRYCTVEFFGDDPPPGECNYDGAGLAERLDLGLGQNANVTITAGGDRLLCWDPETSPSEEPTLTTEDACGSGGTVLAAGEDRPGDQDTTITSRRVVSLHGQTVVLEVMLW